MVSCLLCPWLTCTKSTSEFASSKETKTIITREEEAVPVERTSERSGRSLSCDIISQVSCPQMTDESQELRRIASPKKPRMAKYYSVDTLCAMKYGKPCRPFNKGPPRISNFKPFVRKTVVPPEKRESAFIGENGRKTTVISDWGDCYEDGDIRISSASNFQRVDEDNWSECTGPRYSNSVFRGLGSTITGKSMTPLQEMQVSPGMVWAMLYTKAGQTFQLLNLSFSLQKVVDTFLKAETGKSLPVSFTLSTDTQPKLLPAEKMDLTLSETLKGYLDEETQGLSFFVGPVNGQLCYKMYVSDLQKLQRFFSIQHVC